MATDQRLQALEDEHKVIKGEVKQTLENIRDFLLDLNLPAMQDEPTIGELHEHEEFHDDAADTSRPPAPASEPFPQVPPQAMAPAPQGAIPPVGEHPAPPVSQVTTIGSMPPMPQSFDNLPQQSAAPPPAPMPAEPPPAPMPVEPAELPQAGAEAWPEPEPEAAEIEEEPELSLEDEPPFEELEEWPEEESEATEVEEPEFPLDEAVPLEEEEETEYVPLRRSPRPKRKREESVNTDTSQVNLLTNLIRWVSVARSEIGSEQLATFLDVYCIGEPLSPEIREVIFYLMERIAPKATGTQALAAATEEADGAPPEDTGEVPAARDEAPLAFPGGDADVWNRLILELHGILGNGQAALLPEQLPWKKQAEGELPNEVPAGEEATAAEDALAVSPEATASPPADEITPPGDETNPPEAETKPLEVARQNLVEAIESQEECVEIEVVKKKKPKAKKKKKPAAEPATALDKRAARLKLVLPVGGSGEEEISIGEFFLDMAPRDK